MNDRKLGAAFGAILPSRCSPVDAQHLLHIILHGAAPTPTLAVFVSFISMYFGFGAAITGLHFVLMENKVDRRR